jgi:hypothetical protein
VRGYTVDVREHGVDRSGVGPVIRPGESGGHGFCRECVPLENANILTG